MVTPAMTVTRGRLALLATWDRAENEESRASQAPWEETALWEKANQARKEWPADRAQSVGQVKMAKRGRLVTVGHRDLRELLAKVECRASRGRWEMFVFVFVC